jgi:hypothetical protein
MKQKTEQKHSNSTAVIGLILAVVFSPVGLVISIVAYKKLKAANKSVILPIASIVIASIILVFIYLPILMAVIDKGVDEGLRQLLVE